jgi:small subunit ribosomal protein S6
VPAWKRLQLQAATVGERIIILDLKSIIVYVTLFKNNMDSLPGCDIRVQEPRGGHKLNRYEVIFIAHSDLSKDDLDGLIDRYREIISNFKGMVVKIEKWGMRKLAYKIQKQSKGVYNLIDFVGDAAVVNEMERNFKFDDKVLRFQTIKKADAVDLKEIEKEMSGEKEEKPEDAKPESAVAAASQEVPEAEKTASAEPAAGAGEKAEEGGKE